MLLLLYLGSVLKMTKSNIPNNQGQSIERAPVVAVMGHIDHGKSTLLDYIRKSNVVAGEAGGITQHISAYEVIHEREGKPKKITFLDTPGHEAFATMRERGSLISDIAILVVSAEEGVKAQTLEALGSIKQAGIPFIVAINKIDRPNANPERTKQSLAENEILVESYGGNIPSVNISAVTGEGIPDLLDMLLLVAELEELKGNPEASASGYVLETGRDPKIGTTVTLVIKDGTLNQGDFVIVGSNLAKIKRIEDFRGQTKRSASLSEPVRAFGFIEAPDGGGAFITFHNKKEAEKYQKDKLAKIETKLNTENKSADKDQMIIPLVLKSDTVGTLEAVQREVAKLDGEKVRLKTVQSGIGAINENDIRILTGSEQAIALGFNVSVDATAKDVAERFAITIETFNIIYKLGEWLAEEIEKRRPRIKTEKTVGRAKILKLFSENKNKYVIGGRVTEGKINKSSTIKIWRRESVIGNGKVTNLQQNKAETSEVDEGNEFGMLIETKIPVAPGDILEAVVMEIE